MNALRTRQHPQIVLAAVLTAAGPWGCSLLGGPPERPAMFWIADPDQRVFTWRTDPATNLAVFDHQSNRITLAGSGGETVSFQIVFPAQPTSSPVRVSTTPFRLVRLAAPAGEKVIARIDPKAARFYRVANVLVRTYDPAYAHSAAGPVLPAGFPDALVPLDVSPDGTARLPLSSDEATVVWVELHLPKGLPRASFAADVVVAGKTVAARLPIALESWGFDLPARSVGLFTVLDVARVWQLHGLGAVRNTGALVLSENTPGLETLCEHVTSYVSLITEHGLEVWPAGAFPKIAGRPDAETIDFTGYKRVAEAFVGENTPPQQHWPVPVGLQYPPPSRFGRYESLTYRSFLKRYMDEFYDQFARTALVDRPLGLLDWPSRALTADAQAQSWQALAEALCESAGRLTLINPFVQSNLRLFGFAEFSPVTLPSGWSVAHCPPGSFWEPALMDTLRKTGTPVWWRPGQSPAVPDLTVTAPYHQSRAIPWLAYRYRGDAVVVPHAIGRLRAGSTEQVAEVGSSTSWLVYPGSWFGVDKPVATIRLKMLQRGLQDVAYLRMLDHAKKPDLAAFLARRLVRFGHMDALDGSLWSVRTDGFCHDFRAWAIAPLIAGAAAAGEASPARAEVPTVRYDLTTLKQQFRLLSDAVLVQCQGVKASRTVSPDPDREAITWTHDVVIRNYTDQALSGTIDFGALPEGVSAVTGPLKITNLDWAFPTRVRAEAISTSTSVGLFGDRVQTIVFRDNTGREIVVPARVCAVVAGRLERPIRIDGRLDDWPDAARWGGLAGNFQRVVQDHPTPAADRQNASRRALWPTTVQVGHDGGNLYLAFRCHQPREAQRLRYTNRLHVSNGVGWGEDLVEVLLDPDNRRSFHPRDTYHIVVKANGAVIATRGLSGNALGGSAPWPADIRAAVTVFDDRWQVELAVPFPALGAHDKLDRWWGLDLVRLSAAICEQSSWSGASTQLYKPVSLGNMFVAR